MPKAVTPTASGNIGATTTPTIQPVKALDSIDALDADVHDAGPLADDAAQRAEGDRRRRCEDDRRRRRQVAMR